MTCRENVERVRLGAFPLSATQLRALDALTAQMEELEREISGLTERMDAEIWTRVAAEQRVEELEGQLLRAREAPGGPQDKRVEELGAALRDAQPWLMVSSDIYPQQHTSDIYPQQYAELARVHKQVRAALAQSDPPEDAR